VIEATTPAARNQAQPYTADNALSQVLATLSNLPPGRQRDLFEGLIRHTFAFMTELKPTIDEWRVGLDFLKRSGWKSTETRDEFELISAILGFESYIDLITSKRGAGATPNSILGPFYNDNPPVLQNGADITGGVPGPRVHLSGRVTDLAGAPLAGAVVDIWQSDFEGAYDVQNPDGPEVNLRGRFITGADGAYACLAVRAHHYDVPTDGPAGEMLRAMGRKAARPAHIHYLVKAAGFDTLVTSIYPADDPYLASDAAFGVKEGLAVPYIPADGDAARYGAKPPFFTMRFDIALSPANAR
jgi:hydroxyquinol 1,2-dioxygenase